MACRPVRSPKWLTARLELSLGSMAARLFVRDRSATRQKPLAHVIRLRKHQPLAIVFPPAVGVMLVWIFIAACWAGLLLLILHDVTKDAAGSSAVSVASRSILFTAAKEWRKGWRRLRRLKRYAASLKAGPKVSPEVSPAASPKVSPEASPSEAPAQAALATVPSQETEASKKTWWRRDHRAQITPAELELTIAETIRKTAPECGSFVGVIVHHKKPKQSRDPNWGVRGVKFGKADRRIVEETLDRIVKQLQKEFRLTDPQPRN